MAYTEKQATEELCKHFSRRTAEAIVEELGAKGVFEGAGPAMSDSGKAAKHVETFGHSPEEAAKIVKKVGPHIVLAHQTLNPDPASSFWDPRFGDTDKRSRQDKTDDKAAAKAAGKGGPSSDQ